jgi:hypothetical protein
VTVDDLLERAIAALNEGRKAEARQLLMQILRQDRRNEKAWLWMSGAVDTDQERRVCLEQVLSINPDNEMARRGLELLRVVGRASPPARVPPPPEAEPAVPSSEPEKVEQPPQLPVEEDEAGVSDLGAVVDEAEAKVPGQIPQQQRSARPGRNLAIGLVLFGLFGVILVAAWWAINSGFLSSRSPPPVAGGVTQVISPAGMDSVSGPSGTPPPTWTRRPTDVPATRFPTRTPRPTNTPMLTWTPTFTPTATLTGTFTVTPTIALTLPPTWTPHPTVAPSSGLTALPTWTPSPTHTAAPAMTLLPTWTPRPTRVPLPAGTLPPTWTPRPTYTPVPGLTIPPTWTPRSTTTATVTSIITSTPILTGTLATATPTD